MMSITRFPEIQIENPLPLWCLMSVNEGCKWRGCGRKVMSRTVVCDTYVRVFFFIGNRVLHFMSCNSNDFVAKANRSVRFRDDQLPRNKWNGNSKSRKNYIEAIIILLYYTNRWLWSQFPIYFIIPKFNHRLTIVYIVNNIELF